ncbi:hypothetical protein E0493_11170 [Roseomonas sp. M0104]|uniref:WYL domain-containing protein n=1 Tax=Teichococcus coralli TaxID=2545983 RepID=A0A845BAT9_9PROT|nr:WYL domain-containing protein [Pseudoroseomonas coralli]MXP63905.1 hypothetical protein [Pseudoroseomonas coralli]
MKRADMVRLMGISRQQASQDMANYLKLAPGNAVMDPSSKAWVVTPNYEALFDQSFLEWAQSSAEQDSRVIPVEDVTTPSRTIPGSVAGLIAQSYANRIPLKVTYQSMSREEPTERLLCPHSVVDTGERLHLRAYDSRRMTFIDCIPARILQAELAPGEPWVDAAADRDWHQMVDIVLVPAERLSPSQRQVIKTDYGMTEGRRVIPTRKALLLYTLTQMNLLASVRSQGKRRRSDDLNDVVCQNAEELLPYLPAVKAPLDSEQGDNLAPAEEAGG